MKQLEKWGVGSRKTLNKRERCLGFHRAWLLGICTNRKNTEKDAAKNKPWALLFCLGSVLMTGVSSYVKQNPCQINEKRFGSTQVTLLHCL